MVNSALKNIGCYFLENSAFNINGSTVNTEVTRQKYQWVNNI